jgi:hypothetical protein
MGLDTVLALINALAPLAGQHGQLAASLADVAAKLIAAERSRTGKTIAEILSDAGLLLDSAEQKALEDLAAGQ